MLNLKNEIALAKAIEEKALTLMDELSHHDKMRGHHRATAIRLLHDKHPQEQAITLQVKVNGSVKDAFTGSPEECIRTLIDVLSDKIILSENETEFSYRIK